MICPNCSQDNPEGRNYCRVCAKPLVPQTVFDGPAPSPTLQASSPKPPLSKMALGSLILGFFSLIVPFGIAALVLGHMSRNRIAKSGGRLRGKWLAFAGLILGYIQVPVGALLFLGGIGFLYQFNQEMSRHPGDRAALVAVIKNGGSNKKVPADDPAKYPQEAVEALRMIRARQSEYLNAHPDQGYACRLDQIGEPLNPDNELGTLIVKSHYQIGIERCGTANDLWYTVFASSKNAYSSSPVYCMDSNGVIYKYGPDQINHVLGRLVAVIPELCPQSGESVDQ
jgi:hypothetical protein